MDKPADGEGIGFRAVRRQRFDFDGRLFVAGRRVLSLFGRNGLQVGDEEDGVNAAHRFTFRGLPHDLGGVRPFRVGQQECGVLLQSGPRRQRRQAQPIFAAVVGVGDDHGLDAAQKLQAGVGNRLFILKTSNRYTGG